MSRSRRRFLHPFWVAAIMLLATPIPAPAGDGEFEGDDDHEHGAAYFGEARDVRGLAALEGVQVKVQVRGTPRFFIISTDNEGRFRRNGLGTDVDPDKVDVTCEKSGFKTVDIVRRRMSGAKDAPVEVECLLERK